MGARNRKTQLARMAKRFEGGIGRMHVPYNTEVQTMRNSCPIRSVQVHGATWSTKYMCYTPELQDIRDKTKGLIDKFIDAYLSMDSKR